jgi:hypothetical protein
VRWLPEEPRHRFLADPFGLRRDGRLFVFAEAYDYRSRHGVIEVLELGDGLTPSAAAHRPSPNPGICPIRSCSRPRRGLDGAGGAPVRRAHPLSRRRLPRHLGTALRAWRSTRRPSIPTIFRHEGLWWLAYSPSGPQGFKQGRPAHGLRESLTGPWRPHPGNPVRVDRTSSRPAGRHFCWTDVLSLPVQDCARTYGGAIRLLRIGALTPDRFEAEAGAPIGPPAAGGALSGRPAHARGRRRGHADRRQADRPFDCGLAIDVARPPGPETLSGRRANTSAPAQA